MLVAEYVDSILSKCRKMLHLILGGARSGKTRYALQQIEQNAAPWFYVATAEGHDEEMRQRIQRHQAERGPNWQTIECPIALSQAIDQAGSAPLLIDCLTLWLTNMMIHDHHIPSAQKQFLDRLSSRVSAPTVLVANEVGLGIVPDNALARQFRDHAGHLHQLLAQQADRVTMMVAGLPLKVK